MKRMCLLLALILTAVLAGCCYAPGNEQTPFIEKWLSLPSLPMEEYQSPSQQTQGTEENQVNAAIEAPVVDLDALPERSESDLVKVTDYIPDLVVELKFATTDNYTGSAVYTYTDLYLRYGTVLKLMEVQEALRQQGYLLKVWDGFRTLETQQTLWSAYPDDTYVNDPSDGTNAHTMGNTIDVTLVNAAGEELEMPTAYCEFSALADRDYSDCTAAAAANAQLLQDIMEEYGFEGLGSEWWEFTDTSDYAVETVFDPEEISTWYAVCNDYINIRPLPDGNSDSIGRISAGEQFTLLGWGENNFAYVDYEGQRGYVNGDYIAKAE